MTFIYYTPSCLVLLLLVWLIWKRFKYSPLKKAFLPALLLKLLAGIAFGLLYTLYYDGGDTFNFYYEAVKLTLLFKTDVGQYLNFLFTNELHNLTIAYLDQPRALFMVKLLSAINLITYDSYWVSSLFFSLFSFAGLWALANRLTTIYSNKKAAIAISLLFFPSVVFWSSGIIKEAIALGAIGFLLSAFLGYIFHKKRFSLLHTIVDILMICLLWNTKYYFAGILLLLIMSVVGTLVLKNKIAAINQSPKYQIAAFLGLCFAFLALVSQSHPNFYFSRILGVIADNYYAFAEKSDPGGFIHYHNLSADWWSMLINAPKALFSVFFRPMIGESTHMPMLLAGIENLIIFVLAASAFIKLPKKLTNENRLLFLTAILYCLLLGIFLALSTPNFGTLVRYRVGFLPLLLLIITINNPLIERLNTLVK